MSIAHLDPMAGPRPARRRAKPVPGWMVALGVVTYSALAWTVIIGLGAGLWERLAPRDVFAASHRG